MSRQTKVKSKFGPVRMLRELLRSEKRAGKNCGSRRIAFEALEDRTTPATHIWTGGSIFSSNWTDGFNWSGFSIPTSNESGGTIIQFNGNSASVMDIPNMTIATMRFTAGNNTVQASGLNQTLTFNGAAATNQIINDVGNSTITTPIALANGSMYAVISSGAVSLNGNISGNQAVELRPGSANGTLTLAGGNNSYTGGTLIDEGTLQINSGGVDVAVGSGAVTIGDGSGSANTATLRYLQGAEIPNLTAITVNADGRLDMNNSSDNIGPLTINSGNVTLGSGSITVNGTLNMTGGTISGTGTVFLSGNVVAIANGSSVGATISSQLNVNGATRTLTTNDGPGSLDLNVSGTITGTGGIIKSGAGTMQLSSGPNNNYTGTTAVNDGILLLDNNGADVALGAGALTVGDGTGAANTATVRLLQSSELRNNVAIAVNSDGLLDFNGFSDSIGPVTVNSGNVTVGTGFVGINGDLNMTGGTISSTGAGQIIFSSVNATSNAGGVAATINATMNQNSAARFYSVSDGPGAVDLIMSGQITGTGDFVKSGPGTMQFSGATANNFTGNSFVYGGVLQLNKSAANLAIPATILFVGNPFTPGSANSSVVQFLANNQIPDTTNVTVRTDGQLNVNGFAETFNNLNINESNPAVFLGNVSIGAGTLTVTGATTMNGGTIASTTGQLVLGGNITATSDPSSNPATISAITNLNGSTRTLIVNNGPGAIDLNVTGAVTGTGGIVKAGLGTMQFGGNPSNTYTGLTNVNDGTLIFNNGGPLDAVIPGNLVIGDGAGAASSAVVQLSISQEFSNTGNVTVNNDGLFNLNNFFEDIGSLTINNGSVSLGTANLLVNGAINMTGGTIAGTTGQLQLGGNITATSAAGSIPALISSGINLNGANRTFTTTDGPGATELNVTGVVTGAFGVVKSGAGTMVLSGANNYTGTTTVGAGNLVVNGNQPSSAVSLTGGTLMGVGTVGATNTAGGGMIAPGQSPGVLTVNGDLALGASTTTNFELNGFTPGSGAANHDQLVVNGIVNLANANLTATLGNGFNPPVNTNIVVLANDNFDAIIGTFNGLPEGSTTTISGQQFKISYVGGTGNDVMLTAVNATNVISGTVFNDLDGDGVKDAGELGLIGATVFLDTNNNGLLDGGETSVLSAGDGTYQFGGLVDGNYTVRQLAPASFTQTSTNPGTVNVTGGATKANVDFGDFAAVSITGNVFNDLNGNGIKDAGEAGLAGVTVSLDKGADGTFESFNVTNGNGDFNFANLSAGLYRIRQTLPAGNVQTSTNPVDFIATSGNNLANVSFGDFALINISGNVFNDANGNGAKDVGELGIANVTVNLDKGADGTIDSTLQTDANGNYNFQNNGPGTYRVRHVAPNNTTQTTLDPADITAASGANQANLLFGDKTNVDNGSAKLGVDGLGNPVLNVVTTDLDDVIVFLINAGTGQVDVSNKGTLLGSFSSGTFNSITTDAKGGNDSITVFGNVTNSAILLGGVGNDTITGGGGKTTISGGAGDDSLVGGSLSDLMTGEDGNDTMNGGAGDDFLFGQAGADQIQGGDGNDGLDGGDGNDTVSGEAGSDYIVGGLGNDSLIGGDDNDGFDAGDGNDFIDGGTGNDFMYGFAGQDTLLGQSGADGMDAGEGDDSVDGGTGNDFMYGLGGADTMIGNDGDDGMDGGAGDDSMNGGFGNDLLFGGSGNDNEQGGGGNDSIDGNQGNDTLDGGSENDLIFSSGGGFDQIIGGSGNDTLQNIDANCTIQGGTGNDVLYGANFTNDVLSADEGDDMIFGLSGNDTITSGTGTDTVDGGAGTDVIVDLSGGDVYFNIP